MKRVSLFFAVASLITYFIIPAVHSQTTSRTEIAGVFVASTPCNKGTKPLPGIPSNADCEFIKWELTLFRDVNTNAPTTYKLNYTYGMSEPNTPGFKKGGTRLQIEGTWSIVRGLDSNPKAVIYQLLTEKPELPISFLKLSDGLLHLLDQSNRLMIGSAAWSFTLNRLDR